MDVVPSEWMVRWDNGYQALTICDLGPRDRFFVDCVLVCPIDVLADRWVDDRAVGEFHPGVGIAAEPAINDLCFDAFALQVRAHCAARLAAPVVPACLVHLVPVGLVPVSDLGYFI